MATFSVYNYSTKRFDYYEHPGAHLDLGSVNFSSHRKPINLRSNNKLGTIAESTATTLPPGAKVVGSGVVPHGVIASTSQQLSKLSGDGGAIYDNGRVLLFTAIMVASFFVVPKVLGSINKQFS